MIKFDFPLIRNNGYKRLRRTALCLALIAFGAFLNNNILSAGASGQKGSGQFFTNAESINQGGREARAISGNSFLSFLMSESDFSLLNGKSLFAILQPQNNPTRAIVRHGFNLNGRIEGSVQQLLGENTIFNSGAALTGDLLVPGTPNLVRNGSQTFGGTVQGTGSAQPANYQIILNGNTLLGRLLTRTDPVQLPTVAAPPQPVGTRSVSINNSSQSIGDFSTLRNLTLNGNVGLKQIPPGTYGDFTANGNSGFILGVAGGAQPAVYNFSSLTLNGSGAQLQVAGPVVVTLASSIAFNSNVGNASNPGWLQLKIASGGVTLNGGADLAAEVVAPSGTITISGNSRLTGNVTADRLILNGNGLLKIISAGDTTPPILTVQQPSQGAVTNTAQITVAGTFSDESQTTVTVNGTPATITGNSFTAAVPLLEGTNNLLISALDAAGNRSELTRTVVRDSTAPILAVQAPANNLITNNNQIVVSGTVSDATTTVVKVNGVAATSNGANFTAALPLSEGSNTLTVTALDAANNRTEVIRTVILDTIRPTIEVQQPGNFSATKSPQILVAGTLNDATTATVTVNNQPAAITGNQFSATVQLPAEGENTLTIRAVDGGGNQTELTRYITRDTVAPVINVKSPASNQTTNLTAVTIFGEIQDSTATIVTVNDSRIRVDGNVFTSQYEVSEGTTQLRIKATDLVGNQTEVIRSVVSDATAPEITAITPPAGTVINGATATVQGQVTDATTVRVKVGNTTASVNSTGQFTATNVPVAQGDNQMLITAVDVAGNATSAEYSLIGKDITPPAQAIVFPITPQTRLNFQTIEGRAEPGTKVRIEGGAGAPVTTDAANGSGLFFAKLDLNQGQNNLLLTVRDAEGNVSQPTALSIVYNPNLPLPPAGQAFNVNISAGDAQRGLINQPLPRPLVAIVSDKDGNPVSNVAVRFDVVEGGGKFSNNLQTIEAVTDSTGYARAIYFSGSRAGAQLIRANFAGNTYAPTTFIAEALRPGQENNTLVTGVVRDQNLRALPNVIVRLGGQQTRTGTDGRFKLSNVSSGPHQVLELIGRDQVPFPGRWPNISYDMDVLPNVDNNLGKPLFLPRVNEGVQLPLNENNVVTQDTSVQIYVKAGEPPIRITARAGTRVIFPPDVTDKRLSVTQIPLNRIPMPLEDGLATNLYISVQPSGAIFETPLEVSFPNIDRLPANSPALLMSFDHDAGRYVRVGTGKVTADGRSVVSNPGSGIRIGAWHAVPPPDPKPEVTILGQIQVAQSTSASRNIAFNGQNSNELNISSSSSLEGKHIDDIIAQAAGVRAVVLTERELWHQSDVIALRVRYAAPEIPVETRIDAEVQTSTPTVSLEEVTFDDNYTIRADLDVGDEEQFKYSRPHWTSATYSDEAKRNRKFPIAYNSGKTIKIGAKFKLSAPVTKSSKIKVQADGNDAYDLNPTAAKAENSMVELKPTAVKTAFVKDVIDYIEKFKLIWQVSLNDGEKWEDAGASENPQIYVTLSKPQKSFYTTIHLATKDLKGKNKNQKKLILDTIWDEFKDRNVLRVNSNEPLTYWLTRCKKTPDGVQPPDDCFTPFSLIRYGDGRCGAWQDLFIEVLRTQAVPATEVGVIPKPKDNRESRIVVIPSNPAQGNPTPHNIFNDHALVRVKIDNLNLLYDPSYGGQPYNGANLIEWENASLKSVVYFRLTGNPPTVDQNSVEEIPNSTDKEETQIFVPAPPTPLPTP